MDRDLFIILVQNERKIEKIVIISLPVLYFFFVVVSNCNSAY